MNQKVSIIISAFNAEKYIEKTLCSVLNQTWRELEIIVVNDGSTDNTAVIVESYLSSRLKLVNQSNKGQDAALNEGYRHATGNFIKFLDSDDLLNTEMIALQAHALQNDPGCIAYGEWARFYNDEPEKADFSPAPGWEKMLPLDFLTSKPNGVMLQCGIMLIPRQLIEKAGLWDERLILFNDTEFFTRLILASSGVLFTKGAKLYYRSGMIGSISAGRDRKYYESTFLATSLIAEQLLAKENSPRTRQLISNTFLMQYYHMYPKYPDLVKKHEEQIRHFGYGSYKIEGGIAFRVLQLLFGWKMAKRIQTFFYDAGYLKLLYKLKEKRGWQA